MEEIVTGITGPLGLLAFFGGIALLMWMDARNKRQDKKLAHMERMKALELGQTLPDAEVARASADQVRSLVIGLITFFVPLGLIAAAIGGTALVFAQPNTALHLPLACVIWGVAGLVSLIAVACGLGSLQDTQQPKRDQAEGGLDEVSERIKGRPTLMK